MPLPRAALVVGTLLAAAPASTIVPSIRGEGPSGEYIVRDVTHINDFIGERSGSAKQSPITLSTRGQLAISYTVGLMFGLRRKKLLGSYFFFSAASR